MRRLQQLVVVRVISYKRMLSDLNFLIGPDQHKVIVKQSRDVINPSESLLQGLGQGYIVIG